MQAPPAISSHPLDGVRFLRARQIILSSMEQTEKGEKRLVLSSASTTLLLIFVLFFVCFFFFLPRIFVSFNEVVYVRRFQRLLTE